jgi:hypothetical protein
MSLRCLPLLPLLTAFLATACATAPQENSQNLAGGREGPAIIESHSEPRTIELNRNFQPMHPSTVVADVKDFTAKIEAVTLRFEAIPMEIPMENLGGTLWRAELTQRQLELLAVTGKTIRYEAHVIARNAEGKVGRTPVPVEVAIKAPSIEIVGSG